MTSGGLPASMAAASLRCTCSLATVAYSTSLSLTPACLANSYTCCFCSSSASGVKFGTCQNTIFFARWAWLVLTSHHGAVPATPAAPAALRICRRVTRRSAIGPLPWVIASSFHRTQRQPLHHPPLEGQVDHEGRDAGQARRPHHRAPEEHVLHDEQGEAGGDGPDLHAVREHVRVQELVPRLGEREEGHHRQRG